ncbi:AIM24 family protein [Alteriqipengyuania sp. WL0013]|uniref:AIM24 family protein n=1 Tax=Alteriqipengyuania sp. WL0013 TaxID=3110773 RepID=UPI002B77EA4E|nr:AIM24 family protein [Alteriqipengyuania sp. WL0013]MEB3416189.1 AIM24 family protein [Alteriqipengyuania sp. WL0013]
MRAVLAWLGRTGLLYLLLFAGIAFFVFAWPAVRGGLSGESLRHDAMSVEAVREQLAEDRQAAQAGLEARVAEAGTLGSEGLAERRGALVQERAAIDGELAEGGGWLDSIRPSRILARKRLQLRRAAVEAELAAIDLAREKDARQAAVTRATSALEEYRRIPTERAIAISRGLCRDATAELEAFDEREALDRAARQIFLLQRARLDSERRRTCDLAESRAATRERGLAARDAVIEARARLAEAQDILAAPLPDPAAGVSDTTLRDIALRALLALLAVLLIPFTIRVLFYYVFAPIVARGAPIRLAVPSGLGIVPQAEGGSRPTLSVTLAQGEELLVRQSYLQSSPAGADMRTQWLLSWGSVLTSLASGMAFLTRARGAGGTYGISAREDPFAEIARIDLPRGSALVMQPRALAAIVQPEGQPMPVRSRWRLFSLHAWLTFQLRYLVFHGPGALIVKGGRGVRIEPATGGRRFGQDQLVGFSAHTAYTVTRSETFLPYFFGREPLFRDRVADVDGAEPGILVIEEAPMAGRRKGVRAGLEGAFDAVLKAFGI